MAVTNPAKSAGARYERAAILRRVRRMIRRYDNSVDFAAFVAMLREIEQFLLTRRQRYEKRQGGL